MTINAGQKSVEQLIQQIREGQYFLPSFQRDFVWDADDVKELIESIRKRCPIGVLVLWRPSEQFANSVPFSKPMVDVEGSNPVRYVIDGQQRLTSLLLLFSGWRIIRGGKVIEITPIRYEPGSERIHKGRTGIDLALLVKAMVDLDMEAKEHLAVVLPHNYYERAKQLVNAIRWYTIPVYEIETSGEDETIISEMAEAFIRLNKHGVRISNIELLLSLSAGTWEPGIRKAIEEAYKDLEPWGLELQPFLRLFFANLGLRQGQISKPELFRTTIETLRGGEGKVEAAAFETGKAMAEVLGLLKDELGISHLSLLPSQNTLVPVVYYLLCRKGNGSEELGVEEKQGIISWLLLANFKGRYSGVVDSKLEQDLQTIRNKAKEGFPFKELVSHMKQSDQKISWHDFDKAKQVNGMRSQGKPYLFLLYVLLVQRGATDWAGKFLKYKEISELAKHHVFPRDYLNVSLVAESEDPDLKEGLINSVGNLTWIDKSRNSEIGEIEPNEYIGRYVAIEDAKTHFVPVDNPHLLQVENYEEFLERRLRLIYEFAKQQFPLIID